MMKLDNQTLKRFMTTFYGSGNYEGNYWFVGMEEGGGSSLEKVYTRIRAWQDLGEAELVDIVDFHHLIHHPEYFRNPVKLQRTWMQQARIVLASKEHASTTDAVKVYQRDRIGRKGDETCLLELLPFPSPHSSTWHYASWSDIWFLQDRALYQKYCLPQRMCHLHERVHEYQPKLITFCGTSYIPYWKLIAGKDVLFDDQGGFWVGNSRGTIFVIVKHPAARGITNAYFEDVGRFIRSAMQI
jgi:hypothetical protein